MFHPIIGPQHKETKGNLANPSPVIGCLPSSDTLWAISGWKRSEIVLFYFKKKLRKFYERLFAN